MTGFVESAYVCAGLVLPLYYWPQIVACARDDTLLGSYSMSKAATQLFLRGLMLAFVYQVGNPTMNVIVSLDTIGRATELAAAMWSLRRQGCSWRLVLWRCAPFARLLGSSSGARAAVAPAVPPAAGLAADSAFEPNIKASDGDS